MSDRKGRFVSDLRQQDFEVYEDGVRQSIRLFRHEDIPVTVGLVVDHSGSIAGLHKSPGGGGHIGKLPLHSSDELERAISKTPTTGQTALYDAVAEGLERLHAGSRDKKALIVISDGGDNASARSLAQVLQMAEQSSALVYLIAREAQCHFSFPPGAGRMGILARPRPSHALKTGDGQECPSYCAAKTK